MSIKEQENRRSSMVLYASMFVMGGCGLAYQYTLSKLSSDLLGNSVQQWAITIGVMMFFMGVGSDVQKHFGKSGLLDKFILAEILLAIAGGFSPIAVLSTYGSFPAYFALVQYGFIAVIGLLIGFEIPLLARINERYVDDLKFNIGGILKMDYVGSLAGALAWVFILPKYFSVTEMAFVLGIFSLLAAFFALVYFRKHVQHQKALSAILTLALVYLLTGYYNAADWTVTAEQKLYKERIVFSQTSAYQRAVITQSKGNDISLYINGHLQFNSHDEHIYHENLVHPVMSIAPKIERVLILGGGDGLAAREVLKYPKVKELVLVDLDPMITDLAKSNPYLRALNNNSLVDARATTITNNRLIESGEYDLEIKQQKSRFGQEYSPQGKVKILNIDAVSFLEQVPGFYDIIILDFPDPNSPELAKLYSRRFYELVKRRLTPSGLLAQQSTSPFFAKEAYLMIGRTMTASGLAVVPIHDTVPSFGEWGWWIGGQQTIYSQKFIRSKLKNIDTISVTTKYLTPGLISASTEFGLSDLKSNNRDINTLSSNKVYAHYLDGWQRNIQ